MSQYAGYSVDIPEPDLFPPEPETAYICKSCGDPICVGEEMITLDGEHYHTDCFKESAFELLIEKCGAMVGVAEVHDGRED